ncbi:MAG: helicase [Sphingomonadaceae bacterium]|nr:helicase [Sphingomonadaceae bacterium]
MAVERMLGHSSGMIGFPLRLLAREIYDRVVAARGEGAAALVTGEERIWPTGARYILSTVEAMPSLDPADAPAFVAVDEAQLGADSERGHVFTSRLLHARGREETMILGSGGLRGILRDLLPDADISGRPRFSTLRYSGPAKLSRLPKRSAIIAFSAEEVYEIAEGLRRISGGAAVVMGALSPRTRNAQVAMFQSGEVDYLVATDAVGMGLNLDVDHVAFASLNKFDGHRHRRLTISEMAQIAGRAGRHQRDGSFGTVGGETILDEAEIAAIEEHAIPPVERLYWRDPNPTMDDVPGLIAALETAPDHPRLIAAPAASDLLALKRLADDGEAMARVTDSDAVRRLWNVCAIPDFRKAGPEMHGRLISRLWRDISGDKGHVDADWFHGALAQIDNVDGPVDILASRLQNVRDFCYIAQRDDWLADAPAGAAAARAVEQKLSDALHAALTQRFVDRRTSVLLRALGQGADALSVAIDDSDGSVRVEGERIGALHGFAFRVDAAAGARTQKMLLAAAEKYLQVELARRASLLAASEDSAFAIDIAGDAVAVKWHGVEVAQLVRGRHLLSPMVRLLPEVAALDASIAAAVKGRIEQFTDHGIAQHMRALLTLASRARDIETPANLRAIFAGVVEGGGFATRRLLRQSIQALSGEERSLLRRAELRPGSAYIYVRSLLRPAPLRWVAALDAAWHGRPPVVPPEGAPAVVARDGEVPARLPGYFPLGQSWLRIDMLEKLAEDAHRGRVTQAEGKAPAAPQQAATPAENIVDAPVMVETTVEGEAQSAAEAAPEPIAESVTSPAETPPHPRAFRIDPSLGRSIGMGYADRLLALGALGFRSIAAPPEDMADEAKIWWRWDGLAGDERPRSGARNGQRNGQRNRGRQPQAEATGEATGARAAHTRHNRAGDQLARARKDGRKDGNGDRRKDRQQDGPRRDQHRDRPSGGQRPRHVDGRRIAREREIAAHSPFAALKDMMAAAKPDARNPQKVDDGDTPAD